MSKKITSLILSVLLILSCFVSSESFATVKAATRSELEAKIEKIDEEIAENEEKLSELKDEKKAQQEYLDTLQKQIVAVKDKAYSLQTQIELIDEELNDLNTEIKQLGKEIDLIKSDISDAQSEIESLQESITETSAQLSERLRFVYMNGNDSDLKILMGSKSLAGFLTRLELMKRTSENDREMILDFRESITVLKEKKESLQKEKEKLDEKKQEVVDKKQEVTKKKEELKLKKQEHESTRATLEKKYSEIDKYVESLDKSSKTYQSYIKDLEQQKAQADAEIDRIISQYYATSTTQTTQNSGASGNTTTTAPSGGSFQTNEKWAWPLGTRWCYISSKFGNRNANISGWGFHGGIDIAGGNGALEGAPVYATRSGTVITAVTSYDPRGYGIYVIIDHGDGYSSLYAHMSARYVSTGDKITQGQMIGRVGDTGNSRGAHLHFEIRHYGQKQDPLRFVTNPN